MRELCSIIGHEWYDGYICYYCGALHVENLARDAASVEVEYNASVGFSSVMRTYRFRDSSNRCIGVFAAIDDADYEMVADIYSLMHHKYGKGLHDAKEVDVQNWTP